MNKIVLYYGKIGKDTCVKAEAGLSFLIVMAQNDTAYGPDCNDWFIQKAAENGNHAEKIVHSTGVHGFDYINDDEETRSIIDRTIEFIKYGI